MQKSIERQLTERSPDPGGVAATVSSLQSTPFHSRASGCSFPSVVSVPTAMHWLAAAQETDGAPVPRPGAPLGSSDRPRGRRPAPGPACRRPRRRSRATCTRRSRGRGACSSSTGPGQRSTSRSRASIRAPSPPSRSLGRPSRRTAPIDRRRPAAPRGNRRSARWLRQVPAPRTARGRAPGRPRGSRRGGAARGSLARPLPRRRSAAPTLMLRPESAGSQVDGTLAHRHFGRACGEGERRSSVERRVDDATPSRNRLQAVTRRARQSQRRRVAGWMRLTAFAWRRSVRLSPPSRDMCE